MIDVTNLIFILIGIYIIISSSLIYYLINELDNKNKLKSYNKEIDWDEKPISYDVFIPNKD